MSLWFIWFWLVRTVALLEAENERYLIRRTVLTLPEGNRQDSLFSEVMLLLFTGFSGLLIWTSIEFDKFRVTGQTCDTPLDTWCLHTSQQDAQHDDDRWFGWSKFIDCVSRWVPPGSCRMRKDQWRNLLHKNQHSQRMQTSSLLVNWRIFAERDTFRRLTIPLIVV